MWCPRKEEEWDKSAVKEGHDERTFSVVKRLTSGEDVKAIKFVIKSSHKEDL
jgi:hypothetical protein